MGKLWQFLNGRKTQTGEIIAAALVLLRAVGVKIPPDVEQAIGAVGGLLLGGGLAHKAVKVRRKNGWEL